MLLSDAFTKHISFTWLIKNASIRKRIAYENATKLSNIGLIFKRITTNNEVKKIRLLWMKILHSSFGMDCEVGLHLHLNSCEMAYMDSQLKFRAAGTQLVLKDEFFFFFLESLFTCSGENGPAAGMPAFDFFTKFVLKDKKKSFTYFFFLKIYLLVLGKIVQKISLK